jgi:hypothetical protein
MIVKKSLDINYYNEESSFETGLPESGKRRKKNPLKSMNSLSVKYFSTVYISCRLTESPTFLKKVSKSNAETTLSRL